MIPRGHLLHAMPILKWRPPLNMGWKMVFSKAAWLYIVAENITILHQVSPLGVSDGKLS